MTDIENATSALDVAMRNIMKLSGAFSIAAREDRNGLEMRAQMRIRDFDKLTTKCPDLGVHIKKYKDEMYECEKSVCLHGARFFALVRRKEEDKNV